MTHKSFYEAAAAEVAVGHVDTALWIKACAEMPGADDSARRAKYVALRAQELATERANAVARGWLDRFRGRRWYWWAALIISVYLLLCAIALPFIH